MLLFWVQKLKERKWRALFSEPKLGISPRHILLLFWVQKLKRAKLATFVFGTQIWGGGCVLGAGERGS
jgi:hypothetical protein